MKTKVLAVAAVLGIVVMGYLVRQTTAIDAHEHEQFANALNDMAWQADELEEEIEDVRRGELEDEVDLDSVLVNLRRLSPALSRIPSFTRSWAADSVEYLTARLDAAIQERSRVLDEFKMANRAVHAAVDSLRPVVRGAARGLLAEWDAARVLAVHEHANDWLDAAARGDRNASSARDTALAGIVALAEGSGPAARREVETIIGGTAMLAPRIALADSLAEEVSSPNANNTGWALSALYFSEFDAATARTRRAGAYLAAYAILLLSLLLLAFTRLRRSRVALNAVNSTLEAKVLERTAALARANEDLEHARDEALQASVAKSHFLANMSHELRTPLNSVIGFTNVLLKNNRDALNPRELGFLSRILENGRHLLALINDVLDLSKIEAGKVEVDLSPTRIDRLVLSTLQQFGPNPTGSGVVLRADVPDTVAPIMADEARLKQVLINLIGNALKFTSAGSVTVAVRTHPLTGRPQRIEVIDTGIGIPEDRLDAIFAAFQQADSSTARHFGGTGLGLAISRSLAQLMGCEIRARSTLGEGSVFTIELPAAGYEVPVDMPAPAEPMFIARGAQDEAEQAGTGGLVLIIDDDGDSRVLMTQILEDAGYEALAANSGAQGLRMVREFRPSAILLDLMMPGMSGFDVLRELKSDPLVSGIPVIIVSIVAKEHAGGLLASFDLVEKPLERADLLFAVRRNVRRPGRRILIVDDDQDARHLITGYLAHEDVVIETAGSGAEALAVMELDVPDLVILDLMMPGISGSDCLRAIREHGRFSDLPIIVVTARDLEPAEIDRLKAAATGVLYKGEDLERALQNMLHICLRKEEQDPTYV
ncbi:MAG: response regulator [Gemmatimonadota bacterium]